MSTIVCRSRPCKGTQDAPRTLEPERPDVVDVDVDVDVVVVVDVDVDVDASA